MRHRCSKRADLKIATALWNAIRLVFEVPNFELQSLNRVAGSAQAPILRANMLSSKASADRRPQVGCKFTAALYRMKTVEL